jgi:hypothetical protein
MCCVLGRGQKCAMIKNCKLAFFVSGEFGWTCGEAGVVVRKVPTIPVPFSRGLCASWGYSRK